MRRPMNVVVKSLPNLMTVLRLIAAPVVAALIWIDDVDTGYAPALALFVLASLSDFLDGWMARRMGIVSKFGAMLDPIADKVLIGVCLLSLAQVTGDGWLFFLPRACHHDAGVPDLGTSRIYGRKEYLDPGIAGGEMENDAPACCHRPADSRTCISSACFRE